MSNPAHSIATALAEHVPAHWAAIGGTIGTFIGMVVIVLTGIATAYWMENRHDRNHS